MTASLCREMAKMGKGIGNENRYRILELLMREPMTVCKIGDKLGIPQPAVSQHLKVLKSSSLVTDTREGKEVLYSVNVSYMAGLLKKLAADLPAKPKSKK